MDKFIRYNRLAKDLKMGRGDSYAVPYLMLQYGSKALIPLVKGLQCPTMKMRVNCVLCLQKLGDPKAVDALIQMFDDIDNDPYSREITETLKQLCRWKSLNPIIIALHTGSPRIRGKIARLLPDYKDETILPELIKALKDPVLDVFIQICSAIEAWPIYRNDRESASSALVAYLSDDEPERRLFAVFTLGYAGNLDSAFAIIDTIHTYPNVKIFHDMAGLALAKISEKYENEELNRKIDQLLNSDNFHGKESFLSYFHDWDEEFEDKSYYKYHRLTYQKKVPKAPEPVVVEVNILIDQLKDSDPKLKIDAIEKLGEQSNREATMDLCLMVSDDCHDVQLAAIKALRKIGDKRATATFNQLLPQETCYHREDIAEAMGALEDSSAVPVLAEVYKTAWLELRAEIVRSLGKIGGLSVIDPLKAALKDIHPKIRQIAVNKLYDLQHKRAIKAIRQVVCHEKHLDVKADMVAAINNFEKIRESKNLH